MVVSIKIILGINTKRKRLRPTAIPSENLPQSTVPLQSHKRRRSPKKRDLPKKSSNENYSCEVSTSVEISEKVKMYIDLKK